MPYRVLHDLSLAQRIAEQLKIVSRTIKGKIDGNNNLEEPMKINLGSRHVTLQNIAIQMKAEGKSRTEAVIELHRLNTNVCEQPIRVFELVNIIKEVYGTQEIDTIA